MTTTPTGMTNNQAALLAATTLNANRNVRTNTDVETATRQFKELLNTLDKEDATTQAEAEKDALPAHCIRHLKEHYKDFWAREVPRVRNLKPGEICSTPGCFYLDPATTTEQDTEA